MKRVRLLCAVRTSAGLLALSLSACSSFTNYVSTVKQIAGVGQRADDSKLEPAYRYLRVTVSGNSTFVLLGDIDKLPDGAVEVYYSSTGEVLRFQNGRLAGAIGLTTEWRRVAFLDTPKWAVAADGKATEWTRIRDEMPGYRYGVEDRVSIRKIAPPNKTSLLDLSPESLTWFEETVIQGKTTGDHLPVARYAVSFAGNRETVVYGEQCLSTHLCLAWQQWDTRKQQK
jgi:hypothetical protein